jgi:ADP-heptose:LPS heptosyltransferase
VPEIAGRSNRRALADLDLVVTADTSIAHLAGAMGVKTFVMLAFSPDGRWMLDRSDTPWYPSLMLFRQPRWQDWAPVVQSVVGEVKHMTNMRA